jgi:prepilin-type processing-associated H-X9-DG protein
MYAGDTRDLLPPNPDDGNALPGHNWCSGKAGVGGAYEFNPDILKDEKLSLLSPYLKGNIAVFHCPGDRRTGRYQGRDPNLVGQTVPSARTFSMNQAVGTICPGYDAQGGPTAVHRGAPGLPVNGPWLDNSHEHRRDSPWLTYGKLSSIRAPGPAGLWMLMDEDPAGLNDAAFAFGMAQAKWYDVPGTYHDNGCGLAFADGHSQTHQWGLKSAKEHGWITDPPDQQDWLWLRERTSANVNGPLPVPEF